MLFDNVKKFRQEKGVSQDKLAKLAGITLTTLVKIESGANDNPTIKTVNVVGMRRRGISETSIRTIKKAHRLLFREHKPLDAVRDLFHEQLEGVIPIELTTLLNALERQREGKMGRAREAVRDRKPDASQDIPPEIRRRAA